MGPQGKEWGFAYADTAHAVSYLVLSEMFNVSDPSDRDIDSEDAFENDKSTPSRISAVM